MVLRRSLMKYLVFFDRADGQEVNSKIFYNMRFSKMLTHFAALLSLLVLSPSI